MYHPQKNTKQPGFYFSLLQTYIFGIFVLPSSFPMDVQVPATAPATLRPTRLGNIDSEWRMNFFGELKPWDSNHH